ncbi:MAG: hypothetical protein C4521_12895 [Actinobacteria bacterium]|jgi:hypothetical protein|nr:MAG: hypothetical protein C4521_12895 [Actinomycetota bacterium]
MKTSIVIPSYWTKTTGKPTDRFYNIYDHPTPIDDEGTLGRCLESLRRVEGEFDVVLIGSATEPYLQTKVEERLAQFAKDFEDLNVTVFSYTQLRSLHQRMAQLGMDDLVEQVSLDGYGNIRNLCIIVPHILGSEVVVMIDDDEVVKDPAFLEKALDCLGEEADGKPVWAKTGYYVNEAGSYLSDVKMHWYDLFWEKRRMMNDAFKAIGVPPRCSPTPQFLGGCTVLHREIFTRVSFDPAITRGEDIDYGINAKMHGFEVFLDNELWVTHLPPPKRQQRLVFRADVYRFIYEHRKLEYLRSQVDLKPVRPKDLDPYPGPFVRQSIGTKAFLTAVARAFRDIFRGGFIAYLKMAKVSLVDAPRYAKEKCNDYFAFQRRWPQFMEKIGEDPGLQQHVPMERELTGEVPTLTPEMLDG